MPLTRGMEKEYQEKIATLTAEKEELTERMQHIATESERTVAELHHQLAELQLQVEEAEEARRREGKTLEEIRQLRHENQELQRRMYETEELVRLQKEQVAVMHDSMQDLRQQKNDYRERQQEWRLLAEKREKENQNLRVELEKSKKDGLWKEKILRQRHGYPCKERNQKVFIVNNLESRLCQAMGETQSHSQHIKQHRHRPAYSLALPL